MPVYDPDAYQACWWCKKRVDSDTLKSCRVCHTGGEEVCLECWENQYHADCPDARPEKDPYRRFP